MSAASDGILPEQCSVQVAGVEVTLDASFPALIQLTGLLPVHRRRVLLNTLAAPLCKGWEPQGHKRRCYIIKLSLYTLAWHTNIPTEGLFFWLHNHVLVAVEAKMTIIQNSQPTSDVTHCSHAFPTYRVASLHLIDRCLRGWKP